MFCRYCGKPLLPGAPFCAACGKRQDEAQVSTPSPADATNVAAASVAPGDAPTSGMAIGSLICGLLFFIFPISIVAVILGHLSLSEIKKSAGRIQGHGLAVAGLVLGYVGIAAVPFILIIAAIAIPNLLRARMAANEASAVSTVRQLATAEINYQVAHPEEGYSCDLATVVRMGGLNPELAGRARHGYDFDIRNCASETTGGAISKFNIVAYPLSHNQTGVRAFCTDESGVIRFDPQGSSQECVEHGEVLQ